MSDHRRIRRFGPEPQSFTGRQLQQQKPVGSCLTFKQQAIVTHGESQLWHQPQQLHHQPGHYSSTGEPQQFHYQPGHYRPPGEPQQFHH